MSATLTNRVTISLPDDLRQAVAKIRRQSAGDVIPSESEVIRQLMAEALHHRREAAAAAKKEARK